MINNYDAAKKMLNHGEVPLGNRYKTFRDKLDLFFIDHDWVPLLVQEQYLSSMGDRDSLEDIEKMADAADMISLGDQANIQIRLNQNWSLLPNFGVLSSIGPCLTI